MCRKHRRGKLRTSFLRIVGVCASAEVAVAKTAHPEAAFVYILAITVHCVACWPVPPMGSVRGYSEGDHYIVDFAVLV